MTFLKTALAASALSLATLGALAGPAAFAQEASALTPGATVMGNDGNPVGTIEAVNGDVVTINTGKHLAPVPAALIGKDDSGLSVNITLEGLNQIMDAQVAEAAKRRDAALVVGAEAQTANGNPAGTIVSADLDADAIILESAAGRVAMKKEHFAMDGDKLVVLVSRKDIESAAAAAANAGTGASD